MSLKHKPNNVVCRFDLLPNGDIEEREFIEKKGQGKADKNAVAGSVCKPRMRQPILTYFCAI